MPPTKLTSDDEAFVAHWSQRQFHFIAMTRQADLYLRTVPRETHRAAYKAIAASGWVVGRDWDNPDKGDIRTWKLNGRTGKPMLNIWRLLYNVIPSCLLKTSNAGQMVIMGSIVTDRPKSVQNRFWDQVHKLNNADLEATKERRRGPDKNIPGSSAQNPIDRDSDEDPDYQPFARSRPLPQDPTKNISLKEWKQFERIGETYFVKDDTHQTGFSAFELTGILILKKGTSYKIRYEDCVDSFRIAEQELMALVEDGVWV